MKSRPYEDAIRAVLGARITDGDESVFTGGHTTVFGHGEAVEESASSIPGGRTG